MTDILPEKPRLSFPHPLADSSGDGSVRTESRAALVTLSSGRADLLVTTGASGARPILVTDGLSRLTEPLLALLRDVRGTWAVRSPDGTLFDGLTGAHLERFDDVAAADAPIAPSYLAAPPHPWVRARVVVARRHRADITTTLGGDLELVARHATGSDPVGWGLHEPAGLAWNRDELTAFAREAMPSATRITAVGGPEKPLAATITTHRTTKGVEEITDALVALGPRETAEATAAVTGIPGLLADLAPGMPLIGLAFADTGSHDLARAPVLPGPATPLGFLVGAPGVRLLGLDVDRLADRFGAIAVGRARLPALLFPFAALDPSERWPALRAVLSDVGHDRLSAALGRDTRRLLRLDDGEG